MQQWSFESFVYKPPKGHLFQKSHAQLPTPLKLNEHQFRFYFSSRDRKGRSLPYFLDYDMKTQKLINQSEKPILDLGNPGMFDDSGVMPSCIIGVKGELYLYYIGWNQRTNVSYQLSIGLAKSVDGGLTFKKFSTGPILDRNVNDPIFVAAPCVHLQDKSFVMWYISATAWQEFDDKLEPVYLIKRATSGDGIKWTTTPDISIEYKFNGEALGRPWVVQANGKYYMWYSSRGTKNYRSGIGEHYRMGLATSLDGISWEREDDQFSLQTSNQKWDMDMQEYSSIFEYEGILYMAYNGNTFGRDGFGIARLLSK